MQLTLVLAVLGALVISENAPSSPVSGIGYRLVAAALGVLALGLFAMVSSRAIARGLQSDGADRPALLTRFRRLRQIHALLWLAVAGGILWGLDWSRIVRFNWHLQNAFLLDELLILVPVLAPMVVSWAAFYDVDHALRICSAGPDAAEAEPMTRWTYLVLQARHCLGILLAPVLLILAAQDTARLTVPELLESESAVLVYLPPFVLLLFFFPVMLRHIWHTWPLPAGPLRTRLEDAARRAGFRCRQILVWNTNQMMVNAAVTGFLPSLRYVFLTDGLLSQLTDDEVEAVFAHELGHLRHRHLLLRIAAMAMPLSAWLLVEQIFPSVSDRLEQWCFTGGWAMQAPMGLVMLGAMGSYVGLIFGAYSRLLEGQADLFSCHLQADANRNASAFISALEKLADASGVDRRTPSWQHASIARRVAFLEAAIADPGLERRFHLFVRLISGAIIAIALSPLAYALICRR